MPAQAQAPRSAALKLYNARIYRRRFSWIDDVQLVTDAATESELDDELQEIVASHTAGSIYLVAPAILDEGDVGGFRSRRKVISLTLDNEQPTQTSG